MTTTVVNPIPDGLVIARMSARIELARRGVPHFSVTTERLFFKELPNGDLELHLYCGEQESTFVVQNPGILPPVAWQAAGYILATHLAFIALEDELATLGIV